MAHVRFWKWVMNLLMREAQKCLAVFAVEAMDDNDVTVEWHLVEVKLPIEQR